MDFLPFFFGEFFWKVHFFEWNTGKITIFNTSERKNSYAFSGPIA
jgi:hypothetical protein